MKYIRTKDGTYEVIELHTTTNENGSFISDYFCKGLRTILAKEVIDISLSIEELCDVIVCGGKLFYPLTSNREGNKFNWEEIISCSHNVICNADYKGKTEDLYFNIYGAIWTDKGLIYVAKMNEEGVLCLI